MRRAPERRRVRFWKFFRRNGRESAAPGAASSGPGRRVVQFCWAIRLCQPGSPDPATNCGSSPSTRIPLPSHAAAAACRQDTCPASHSARRPLAPPRYGTRHRIAPPSRTRPRATACRHLHARLFARPARSPTRRNAMAVGESPPFARDRDVALGALAARRPRCRAIAARHVGHLPVPSHAGHFVRQRPRKEASECGGLYHPVINPALTACLADP